MKAFLKWFKNPVYWFLIPTLTQGSVKRTKMLVLEFLTTNYEIRSKKKGKFSLDQHLVEVQIFKLHQFTWQVPLFDSMQRLKSAIQIQLTRINSGCLNKNRLINFHYVFIKFAKTPTSFLLLLKLF